MVGWKHYKHLHGSDIPSQGTNIVLEREPDNEYDANAIAVLSALARIKIGHISKDQAALLASPLDFGAIEISSASIRKIQETSFQILVQGVCNGSIDCATVVNSFESKSVLDLEALSPKIAQNDVGPSFFAPYKLDDLNVLPWNPLADWRKTPTETPFVHWEPFDASRFYNPPLSLQEIQASKTTSWAPLNDVFLRLGMAPGHNAEWWYRVAGLKPPCE